MDITFSDNSYKFSLRPFRVTADSTALADITLALIGGSCVSVDCAAINSRFVNTKYDEGAGFVFLCLTDTRNIDTLFIERGT